MIVCLIYLLTYLLTYFAFVPPAVNLHDKIKPRIMPGLSAFNKMLKCNWQK